MMLSSELRALPPGWTSRIPDERDLGALAALRAADQEPWTGSARVDPRTLAAEVIGTGAWSRRQLVAFDPTGWLGAWVVVQDRAAGRTTVDVLVDRSLPSGAQEAVAAAAYAWTVEAAGDICSLRRLDRTRLDASPYSRDEVQLGWLRAAGYARARTWQHMSRPVASGEEDSLPVPRDGVLVRRVAKHSNGIPVARELHIVHQMLEQSFEDHFNSYRESFPEFLQRLREDPGHRWDHWWLAFVADAEVEDLWHPAGAAVSSVLPAGASGREGTYLDYIGVNRLARGRGVAKALLFQLIRDAGGRGRDRVELEVDADSPTGADGIYTALGWETDYLTDSWFRELSVER